MSATSGLIMQAVCSSALPTATAHNQFLLGKSVENFGQALFRAILDVYEKGFLGNPGVFGQQASLKVFREPMKESAPILSLFALTLSLSGPWGWPIGFESLANAFASIWWE